MSQKTKPPVRTGGIYPIEISGLGHSGEGVGRYQDFTVFVPHALPGEVVQVQISEVKKTYAKGQLLSVIQASSDRVEPRCSIYNKCGGCQLQHLSYQGQLAAKRQQVVDAVTRIGKLTNVVVHPTLGAADPWHYRNKMQFPAGYAGGELVVGCYAQGTHDIIAAENCLIQHHGNNMIAAQVQRIAAELGISAYDERNGTGILRHVMGRVGAATGEVMAVLVTATDKLPRQRELVTAMRESIPGLVSIIQNINSRRTNIIFGDTTRTLWGKDTITDRLGNLTFQISARSFFQVNTTQTVALYNQALAYARLSGSETVIDAYCGAGTISLFLAAGAAKVYGIEIVPQAIDDAKQNAQLNNIDNVEFIVGDAVEVMPQLYKQGIRPEVVVVDPPRAGCEQRVLETFSAMEPHRIVYVSCNPASLARDLAVLAGLGYETKEIQPVDMFSQTFHVESVCSIERKSC